MYLRASSGVASEAQTFDSPARLAHVFETHSELSRRGSCSCTIISPSVSLGTVNSDGSRLTTSSPVGGALTCSHAPLRHDMQSPLSKRTSTQPLRFVPEMMVACSPFMPGALAISSHQLDLEALAAGHLGAGHKVVELRALSRCESEVGLLGAAEVGLHRPRAAPPRVRSRL